MTVRAYTPFIKLTSSKLIFRRILETCFSEYHQLTLSQTLNKVKRIRCLFQVHVFRKIHWLESFIFNLLLAFPAPSSCMRRLGKVNGDQTWAITEGYDQFRFERQRHIFSIFWIDTKYSHIALSWNVSLITCDSYTKYHFKHLAR